MARHYLHNEAGEVRGFGDDDFYVATVDRRVAVDVIKANHYSRRVYNGSYIHLGVFTDDLRGVLQFGYAMNPASAGSVVSGTQKHEYLELNRMWLDDSLPRNSESRAIAYAIKYVKAAYPSVGWIQSFADERCGRFGVVYQAANFLYCGEHVATFWELDGDWYHNRAMSSRAWCGPRAAHLQANRERAIQHRLRQFRYIYFVRPEFRRRLLKPVYPYPKHAPEASEATRRETNAER